MNEQNLELGWGPRTTRPHVILRYFPDGRLRTACGKFLAGLVDNDWVSPTELAERTYVCETCQRLATKKLTKPQLALLERVRREGKVTLNGRATKTIQALENAGLVNVDWDMRPHAIGLPTWNITVTPKEQS